MASQYGDNSEPLIVRSIASLANGLYELVLEHRGQEHVFAVHAVEPSTGIRGIEDTEPLFRFLSERGHLGAPRYLADLVWQVEDGLEPSLPVLIDYKNGLTPLERADRG